MSSFSQIVNSLLYIISGFFFGIFASRHSILAFLVFPSWMASRTTIGAIAYYAVLLFYFSKGWKNSPK